MRRLLYCFATLFSLTSAAWEPPAWEALSFERSYFWVTARAELALTAPPDDPGTCRRQLLVQSSLSMRWSSLISRFAPPAARR